jgi:DivIVA domain-containing protein
VSWTPADVRSKQFSTTRLRPGYDAQKVNAFIHRIEDELGLLIQDNEGLRANLDSVLRGRGKLGDIPQQARRLSPADVRNKQFSTSGFRSGYDAQEVDAFLDEVEAEIGRLIHENDELRARLTGSTGI